MKHILHLCLALLLVIPAYTFSQATDVLFIGNSYTQRNNLPSLVRDAALSTGDTIFTQAHTPGGARLMAHASNTTVHQLISSKDWDFVVLQAQSQEPSFSNNQVAQEVYPYARILCDSIRKNNSCTTPLFYMTWGRKNGDSRNCAVWPPVCTYEGMDSMLNLRYRTMANDNEALVSPVGAVWNYIRQNYPAIELYTADESHPSREGSYAAACAFYTIILQKDPAQISFDANLDSVFAANIRTAAKAIVFDSLAKWNVGKFDPKADFNVNQTGRTFSFNNQSQYSDSVHWDFGDGNSSTELNPDHLYTDDGVYTATLISSKCGKADTATQEINYSTVGIGNTNAKNTIQLSPNPVNKQLKITGIAIRDIAIIRLYGIDGKYLKTLPTSSATVSVSTMLRGTYFMEIESKKKEVYRIPFIKY